MPPLASLSGRNQYAPERQPHSRLTPMAGQALLADTYPDGSRKSSPTNSTSRWLSTRTADRCESHFTDRCFCPLVWVDTTQVCSAPRLDRSTLGQDLVGF